MSGMREISEQKANALNFLNTVLSTNQRPRFWALNQWEASLQFLRFWLTYKIKLQSQQSDSHLSNQTAIWAIRLQSSYTVVWLWRLRMDCWDCSLILEVSQNWRTWNSGLPLVVLQKSACTLSNQTAMSAIRLQPQQSDCNLSNQTAISTIGLQSPQSDCYAGGLQSDCWDCRLIAEMALWLLRLQFDFGSESKSEDLK